MHPEQFTSLLPLLVILIVAVVLVIGLRAVGGGKVSYERREKLFSPAERSFLGVLDQLFENEYRVLGKIRLSDIIQPRKGLSKTAWATANNRIDRKHIDFAICDPRTLYVVGVVELDDASHSGVKRQRTDKFVDAALAAAGVPIVRIPAQRGYTPAEIRERVSVLFNRA